MLRSMLPQTAVTRGDLSQQITEIEASGEALDLVNTINRMVGKLALFATEVKKVLREVGTEGRLGGQTDPYLFDGTWQSVAYVPCHLLRHV